MLDGGALIQRIPWARGATYREICSVYTAYVLKKYGEAVVVFDGYDGKSTKDMTHQRQTKGQAGVTVTFTRDMQLTMKKDRFLANKTNKQQLIKMVGDHLVMKKCEVHHAPGDADLLIVPKAVELATRVNTVLVGDDTDLLILLCYHANLDSHSIFFRPEPKKGTKNPRVWDIKAVKKQLGHEICTHILFLHAVLECDASIASGRETRSRNSSQANTFVSKLRCLMHSQLPLKMLLLQGSKHWSVCIMGNLGESLLPCAISDFARRWLLTLPMLNHKLCHPLQLQQSITAFAYSSRYSSGRVLGMNSFQRNGGGGKVMETYPSANRLAAGS